MFGDGQEESTYFIECDTHVINLEPYGVITSEEKAIDFVFPDVNSTYLCSMGAIFTTGNAVIKDLNRKIMQSIDGDISVCWFNS